MICVCLFEVRLKTTQTTLPENDTSPGNKEGDKYIFFFTFEMVSFHFWLFIFFNFIYFFVLSVVSKFWWLDNCCACGDRDCGSYPGCYQLFMLEKSIQESKFLSLKCFLLLIARCAWSIYYIIIIYFFKWCFWYILILFLHIKQ